MPEENDGSGWYGMVVRKKVNHKFYFYISTAIDSKTDKKEN